MSTPASLPVVLASTSPRRIELLGNAGFKPLVLSPQADEKRLPREKPAAMVARLARLKAESAAEQITLKFSRAVVISADTIVLSPGQERVLGKPRDRAEAIRMLRNLCGRTHTVLTGYCILPVGLDKKKPVVRVVRSSVKIRALPLKDIQAYVDTGEPMDKAGAYAAQGLGMVMIEKINGSYTNVVGLPMAQLLMDLEDHFGLGPFGPMIEPQSGSNRSE